MGEIADLMLNGEICEGCQCELKGDPPGHPRYCRDCKIVEPQERRILKVRCKVCARMVKANGLADHNLALHSERPKP